MLWSNQVASYQAAMTDEVGMTTLPVGGGSYVIQMSQYLGINKDSENKEAAALFVNFFVTSPEAARYSRPTEGAFLAGRAPGHRRKATPLTRRFTGFTRR